MPSEHTKKLILGVASRRRSLLQVAADLERLEGRGEGLVASLANAELQEEPCKGTSSWSIVRSKQKHLKLCMARERLKKMQIYQDLEPDVQAALLDALNYQGIMPRGTVLFKQGDIPGVDDGGECYIIMSGEVSVWMMCPEDLFPSSPTNGAMARGSSPTSPFGRPAALLASVTEESKSTKGNEDTGEHGTQVAAIGPGSLVGHHALLRTEARTATCVTSLDCEMLSLRRSDFDRVLKPVYANKKDAKEAFLLTHVPGLASLEHIRPETVLPNFSQAFYKKGHIFCHQGLSTECTALYVLLKGVVEVRHQRVAGEPERVISTLLPGAIFGTTAGEPDPFKLCVGNKASCDVYQAKDNIFSRLPAMVKQATQDHISKRNEVHLGRTWPVDDGGNRSKEWWAESEGMQHIFGSKAMRRCASSPADRRSSKQPSSASKHLLREASKHLAANPWKTPPPTAFKGGWKNWTIHGRSHIQTLIFEDMAPLAVEGRVPEYKDLSGWLKPCPASAPFDPRSSAASPEKRRPGSATTKDGAGVRR